jgi:hypothetical protein
MIEEAIKQTRCTTCDAEHAYKGGQAPRRRKKESSSALYKEVLAGKPEDAPHLSAAHAARAAEADDIDPDLESEPEEDDVQTPAVTAPAIAPLRMSEPPVPPQVIGPAEEDEDDEDARGNRDLNDGPVHRPLIRATLPRPEGQKEARNPPDFTIRQAGGRGGNANQQFRGGGTGRTRPRGGGGQANGHRSGGGGHGRFAGARPGQGGQPRGQGGNNFRAPQQPRHGGGNRKRSR